MVLIRILGLLLIATAPASAAVFNPVSKTLPNGLQVIVAENHRAPVVLHMLWYKTGAADEPASHAGLAHFMEHMMFKGTHTHPEQDFSAEIAALGGEDNAFTSYDYTAFFQRIDPSQLETVMGMEAERMSDLELDAHDMQVEKSVVTQERAQRTSTPQDRFQETISAAFYGTHPYARPVIGWDQTIADYSTKALQDYYNTHYRPNNAVLVISGAVTPDNAFAMAEKAYGDIAPADTPVRARTGSISTTPARLTQTDKDVKQPQLAWMWPAPSMRTAAGNDAYALQVLTEILNAADGVLMKTLVHDTNIAVGVSASYNDASYDTTDFSVAASPAPNQTLDRLENALRKTWPKALQSINETSLKRAKQRLIDGAALARDSIQSPSYVFGTALATGSNIEAIENWPDSIAAVSLADVQRVAGNFTGTPLLAARLEGEK